MKKMLISLLLLQILSHPNLWAKSLGPHVHGSVHLDMATDKKQLLVMLKSPAESFLDFEYRPKTRKEKKLQEKVKSQWNQKLLNYLGPQTLKDCKITKSNWKQEFNGQTHSSIIAESYIE